MMATIDVFDNCNKINELLNQGLEEEARSAVIMLLQRSKGQVSPYEELVNHLIREVGLYPYIISNKASWEDAFVYEAFKVNTGEKDTQTLHLAQSEVLSALLKGESLAVSAPTSFGKSFVIDAFIAIKEPKNVVIIVPTIALADETRRRLFRKFSSKYKIITTTGSSLSERNILILPQERAFAFIDILPEIDIFIVDEFYKASTTFERENERANSLLTVMARVGVKAKQRYYLAPNINAIQPNVFTDGMRFMRMDFKTVVTVARKIYDEKRDDESQDEFVERMLPLIMERYKGKTLVYAGSYEKIRKVSNLLVKIVEDAPSQYLIDFSDWLKKNYSPNFMLANLVAKGIGIHNGSLHRSLAQIQIKMFEEERGIDTLLSTSSIIEGVNTQAENVILLSNNNGSKAVFDYFTYRNIIGRAGRMFRYFVGRVFLLVKPPEKVDTQLNLTFPDDVALSLDPDNPEVELNIEQRELQRLYHAEMEDLIGAEHYKNLKDLPIVQAASPTLFKDIVETVVVNPDWPTNHKALLRSNTYDWRVPLNEVIKAFAGGNVRNLQIAVWKMSENWYQSTSAVIAELVEWGVPIDDFFSLERSISYNLSTALALINAIRLELIEDAVDLTPFISKVSYAFLPRLVFQLEEYGLPRMISKQLSRAGLFDFEDDEKDITEMIKEFQEVGYERVVSSLPNRHPFDVYVLKHFFNGISCIDDDCDTHS